MEINVKGPIISTNRKWIYDWLEMEGTCPRDVTSALEKANGEDVDIYINSGGGEVFAGSEIYNAIRAYKGRVKIHVVGLAASAASVIMCAAPSDIAPTSMVMIHNVSSYAEGDYQVLGHEAEVLRTASRALCNAYVEKTGKSAEEMQALMDKETWYTAQEAVDMGLCDEVAGTGLQLVAACAPVIPAGVAEKMAARLAQEQEKWIAVGEAKARRRELEGRIK